MAIIGYRVRRLRSAFAPINIPMESSRSLAAKVNGRSSNQWPHLTHDPRVNNIELSSSILELLLLAGIASSLQLPPFGPLTAMWPVLRYAGALEVSSAGRLRLRRLANKRTPPRMSMSGHQLGLLSETIGSGLGVMAADHLLGRADVVVTDLDLAPPDFRWIPGSGRTYPDLWIQPYARADGIIMETKGSAKAAGAIGQMASGSRQLDGRLTYSGVELPLERWICSASGFAQPDGMGGYILKARRRDRRTAATEQAFGRSAGLFRKLDALSLASFITDIDPRTYMFDERDGEQGAEIADVLGGEETTEFSIQDQICRGRVVSLQSGVMLYLGTTLEVFNRLRSRAPLEEFVSPRIQRLADAGPSGEVLDAISSKGHAVAIRRMGGDERFRI